MKSHHYMAIAFAVGIGLGFFVTSLSRSGPGLSVYNSGATQTLF
jgi:hypothetical protein